MNTIDDILMNESVEYDIIKDGRIIMEIMTPDGTSSYIIINSKKEEKIEMNKMIEYYSINGILVDNTEIPSFTNPFFECHKFLYDGYNKEMMEEHKRKDIFGVKDLEKKTEEYLLDDTIMECEMYMHPSLNSYCYYKLKN